MAGVNKIILIGRLGQEPELRYTSEGAAVANFSVATSDEWRDKESGEKREKVEWHSVIVWNKMAEVCDKYLSKGSQVYVEGKLQTRSWEKDGQKHYKTEILAQNIRFLDTRKNGQSGQSDAPIDEDDIPF